MIVTKNINYTWHPKKLKASKYMKMSNFTNKKTQALGDT